MNEEKITQKALKPVKSAPNKSGKGKSSKTEGEIANELSTPAVAKELHKNPNVI